jgi:hypothetical protein
MTSVQRSATVTALCAVTVLVAGCTTVMDGAAARDPGFKVGAVDASLLDAANYPTRPRPPLGAAGAGDRGALLDAQSLAEYVTGAWEVDPAMISPIHFGGSPAAVAMLPDNIGLVFMPNSDMFAAMARRGVINGFAAGRQVKKQRTLVNVVLRYPDAASAAATVAEAAHANPRMPDFSAPPLTPVAIPGHGDAVATTYTWDDPDLHATWATVQSFTARGPFVLFQRAEVVGPADAGAALVGKTLDLQGPALDKYTPVDPAQFPTLPRDPSGVLALALPVGKGDGMLVNNATYGPHGMLHFQTDPVKAMKTLADAGMDVAVQGAGWLERARDEAGAAVLLDSGVKSMEQDGPVDKSVPNLPGSRCQEDTEHNITTCDGVVGRYYYEVWGHTVKDAYQKAAAQHLILAAS